MHCKGLFNMSCNINLLYQRVEGSLEQAICCTKLVFEHKLKKGMAQEGETSHKGWTCTY